MSLCKDKFETLVSNFFLSPSNFTSESARSPFNFSEKASISETAFLASDNCCCNSSILEEKKTNQALARFHWKDENYGKNSKARTAELVEIETKER